MPRKHLIASGINKKQQIQAKTWMKCAKEIKAATKVGGPNPESNPRLKAAIDRALQQNLSRDSINRNINGAQKDPNNLKELVYEGYGPSGLAIIIKLLTDNEQRAMSYVRGYFSKLHGQMSKPNSVRIQFNEYGQIIVAKSETNEEAIMEATMDSEVIEIKSEIDAFEILVSPTDFFKAKDALEAAKIKIFSSEIKLIPNSTVDLLKADYDRLEKFIDLCEDDDDIQWVVTNLGEIIE